MLGGCIGPFPESRERSLRISELADAPDPARRASIRLVLEGLSSEGRRAQGLFDRALQVDSSNPYAYLALARHYIEAGDADRALGHLRRAEDLLRAYELWSPGAEVHVMGLRGSALRLRGDELEAREWLERAARRDPRVWGDGDLSAAELR